MKKRFLTAALVPAFAMFLGACEVRQTEEGDMPDVDVEGGQLPEYDVDAAPVRVGTDTQTVVVPDVDVGKTDTVRDTVRR